VLRGIRRSGILAIQQQSEICMKPAADSLASMGAVQLLLAMVFLASYALALGKIAVARGRLVAAGVALIAAIGFVASGSSWEVSLLLVACVPVGLGLFAAFAWGLWIMATWTAREADVSVKTSRATAARVAIDGGGEADLSAARASAPGSGWLIGLRATISPNQDPGRR
jgi:hypothetical protein